MAGSRLVIEVALELSRLPVLAGAMRKAPLPAEVGVIIRVAGGCRATLEEASVGIGRSQHEVLEACTFYVQQVLLDASADSYRALGGAPGTALDVLREHRNWLLRRFHPDARSSAWEALYARRVLEAWREVKSGAPIDLSRPPSDKPRRSTRRAGGAALARPGFSPPWIAQPPPPTESVQRTSRRALLGLAMAGSLALACASCLAFVGKDGGDIWTGWTLHLPLGSVP